MTLPCCKCRLLYRQMWPMWTQHRSSSMDYEVAIAKSLATPQLSFCLRKMEMGIIFFRIKLCWGSQVQGTSSGEFPRFKEFGLLTLEKTEGRRDSYLWVAEREGLLSCKIGTSRPTLKEPSPSLFCPAAHHLPNWSLCKVPLVSSFHPEIQLQSLLRRQAGKQQKPLQGVISARKPAGKLTGGVQNGKCNGRKPYSLSKWMGELGGQKTQSLDGLGLAIWKCMHSPRWERSSVGRKRGQTTRQAQSLDGWKNLEKRKDKPGQVRLWSQAGCAQCPSQISHTLKSRHTRFKNGNFTRSRSSMTRGGLTGVAGLVPFNLLYWVNKMFMVARRTSDKLCLICNKKNMKCKRQTSRRSAWERQRECQG